MTRVLEDWQTAIVAAFLVALALLAFAGALEDWWTNTDPEESAPPQRRAGHANPASVRPPVRRLTRTARTVWAALNTPTAANSPITLVALVGLLAVASLGRLAPALALLAGLATAAVTGWRLATRCYERRVVTAITDGGLFR